ncbi:Fic family protein [Candidatus Shapirobacteria bacterium]|nr:Fic family protein [Candidatus Shapirobacteria bacterium]
MLIPPKYFLTREISQRLQSIEASKEVINNINIPPEIEANIRRRSTLKSSLFSARIEGNPLTLEELQRTASKDQKKKEVFNILQALNWVYQRGAKGLTAKNILDLHQIVMKGLIEPSNLGKFRSEVSAIFNANGIAVYLPPSPKKIPTHLKRLLNFINSDKEPFVPIRACLAHYSFEKIHPFLDGNGRVGRLLLQAVLAKSDYAMKGLICLEENLDQKRSQYYRALDEPEKDVSAYLEFMLSTIDEAAKKAKEEIAKKQRGEIEDFLLPRRAEILNIIRGHEFANFDLIRRRFLAVNERTLRYDLKKLINLGLVKKLGKTRGVYYRAAKKVS